MRLSQVSLSRASVVNSKYKHTDSDSDNWGNVTKITSRRRAINRQDGFLEKKETKTLETSDDIGWKI